MNLTPVRVRRKRHTPDGHVPGRLRHPPVKPKSSLAAALNKRALRKRATIHSLPIEIIETILLYSRNLSLPHADPLIGVKLSDRATLLRLFILAFHDTWEQWFGIPAKAVIANKPENLEAGPEECEGDYKFQTAVLQQPWVNIDIVLQAQQTWAEKQARGRWYQHSIPWIDEDSSLGHSHEGGFGHFHAHDCFNIDYQQFLKYPSFHMDPSNCCMQDVHPRTQIPRRLLTGPWNDDEMRLLFWLTRGGVPINSDEKENLPWQIKLDCLTNAVLGVSEPNAFIINCLIREWIFTGLPPNVYWKEIAGIDKRLKWGHHSAQDKETLLHIRNGLQMLASGEFI